MSTPCFQKLIVAQLVDKYKALRLTTVFTRAMDRIPISTPFPHKIHFNIIRSHIHFFLSPTSFYLTRLRVEDYYSFDHTQWQNTVGRTPLNEWSARRRDLYLTAHNTYNRKTSLPSAGFEPAIPAGESLQAHALDRSATGIDSHIHTSK